MNAIVTIAIGPEFQQLAAMTAPLLSAYARRLNADFISIHHPSRARETQKNTALWAVAKRKPRDTRIFSQAPRPGLMEPPHTW